MPLRPLFAAVCLAAIAAAQPAIAQEVGAQPAEAQPAEAQPAKPYVAQQAQAQASEQPSRRRDMASKLNDPKNQIAATVALTALAESLLDKRVGPVRDAMLVGGSHRAERLPRDARLRDVLGPKADRLPRQIGRHVPQAMGRAASMADALQEMQPGLKAKLKRMKSALREQ